MDTPDIPPPTHRETPPVSPAPGTVYLLHFSEPFGHARHYLGWAADLERRLDHHSRGTGANLLRHAGRAGVTWQLARVWVGDRHRERQLHNGGHARRCPICKGPAPDT